MLSNEENARPGAPKNENFFRRSKGEIASIILSKDWSQSAIGPIDSWPLSLCTTLANILNSAFPMLLFWGDDLICFYNDAFRPSLGIEGKHPAIGKTGKEMWQEIWDTIYPLLEGVRSSGEPVWFEDRLVPFYRNNKLEDIYWTFSYSPAHGDDGEVTGVLVTCMETTVNVLARQQVNELVALRTRELQTAHESVVLLNEYFQRIINFSKEPIQVLEPIIENGEVIDFRFKFTNQAYAAYANSTPQDLHNKRVGELFPGYFQTTSFTNVVKSFQSGIADTWELHYNVDGLDLYNKMSAVKMDDDIVVLFTDFTELKNLQFQLLGKITELERSNRNLEEFAHAASHDLKEPNRKISMFLGRLRTQVTDKLDENDIVLLDKIHTASERMTMLIDDLLLYSSMNTEALEKESVDLNRCIGNVLEDLELDINEKKAQIQVSELPKVKGFRRQLQQLFQNLISNSLKYHSSVIAPEVFITEQLTKLDGVNYHVICVKDNGIGFEQKYADKIFQMFARLHGTNEYGGTGIGLSIVRKVIENHNGKVTADSQPGQGATFKIYLPTE